MSNIDYTDQVRELIKDREEIRGLSINFMSQSFMEQIMFKMDDLERMYEYARFIRNDELLETVLKAITRKNHFFKEK